MMILFSSVIGLGRVMQPKPSLWDVRNLNCFWEEGSLTDQTNYLRKAGLLPLDEMQGTTAALIYNVRF